MPIKFLTSLSIIFLFLYLIISICFHYFEIFNSLLFILSFILMIIELIKLLWKQSSFHLIKYTIMRTKYHLTPNKQKLKIDSLEDFYNKNSHNQAKASYLLIIDSIVFIETILIAFIKQ